MTPAAVSVDLLAVVDVLLGEAAALIAATPVDPELLRHKGARNLVTATDTAVEAHLTARLSGLFPDHGVHGEEGTRLRPDAPLHWVIDPLDGTSNYVLGLPMVGVALGLFDTSGEHAVPVAGGIRLVTSGDVLLYRSATATTGATVLLNGIPVRPASVGPGISLLTGYEIAANDRPRHRRVAEALAETGLRLLETFGPTTDWVAFCAGRISAVALLETDAEDTQVGLAAALAAGAVVTTPDGHPVRFLTGPMTCLVTAPDAPPELTALAAALS